MDTLDNHSEIRKQEEHFNWKAGCSSKSEISRAKAVMLTPMHLNTQIKAQLHSTRQANAENVLQACDKR